MPIAFDDDATVRPPVRIIISPASEMFVSLLRLVRVANHPDYAAWAATARAAMPPALWEEIAYFGRCFRFWLDAIDLALAPDILTRSVPEFLDAMDDLSAEEIARVALHGLVSPEPALHADALSPEAVAARTEAMRDPLAFKARFVTTLRQYWQSVFAAEWKRRWPLLEQFQARETARLTKMDPFDWLHACNSHIMYDAATETLLYQKTIHVRFPLREIARITCIPSTFMANLVGRIGDDVQVFLDVPFMTPAPERVPSALLATTKALADETRLLVYKAVLQRPQYTQELAAMLHLAEPTISRHLKILKAAGFVQSRKDGAVVRYSGIITPVENFPASFSTFLRG